MADHISPGEPTRVNDERPLTRETAGIDTADDASEHAKRGDPKPLDGATE